jgi:diguanylate cyclase (GGDEF)-like protein
VLDLVVNLCIITSFVCLHHGVLLFLREPVQPRWGALAFALMAAVEVVHHVPWGTLVLRTWLFTLATFICLLPLGFALLRGLPRKFSVPPWFARFTALPVLLTAVAFGVRALAISYSDLTGVVALDVGSGFDIIITLAFLVFLGMFNFSLYNLVLGALIRRLEDLAATDQLTGLNNRRVAMERLDEEHARFQRSGQRYALVMMDLDHFKSINDQHGHGGGDAVLREVARRLLQSVRSTDTLARVGGEEFLLLLPMNDIDGALVHAGRIRKHVATNPVHTPSADVSVTVSLGVAEVLDDDASAQSVVSRADAALYRAKAAGRNRVEAAPRVALPQAV